MADYIHGGSDAREVARLEKQARFLGPNLQIHLRATPGQRVLDLATGVGAMAGELRRRFPSVEVIGLDLRRSQLSHAVRNHPDIAYVQADGSRMPFPDASFDHVHCSWLLEHVPAPVAILGEVHRVLKPGGEALFMEVDNQSFRTTPVLPDVAKIVRLLDEAQLRAKGDPYVGVKLEEYFRSAGFSTVEILPAPLHGHGGERAFFQALIDEFAEIFESLDEAFAREEVDLIPRAAAQLRGLIDVPGGELYYRAFIGRGTK